MVLKADTSAATKAATEAKPSLEGLFLDFSKTHLGPLHNPESRQKYQYTIQLEKARLMDNLLHTIYENAYELYKRGDYEGARELSGTILSMDPDFKEALVRGDQGVPRFEKCLRVRPFPYRF